MMASLSIFFEAYKYLIQCVRDSLKSIDQDKLKSIFEILIEGREKNSSIIVDGQGRSLQSMLIMEDCLEHNGFPIIFPASNANLRPWKPGDIFFFNSGSGSGSPLKHAIAAHEDKLHVLGMTYNTNIGEKFSSPVEGILKMAPSTNKNKLYAPLGTEFELTSAVIGASLGYGVNNTPEESIKEFNKCSNEILKLFDDSVSYYEKHNEGLHEFIDLIKIYIDPDYKNNIYFRGVGRDSIINQVSAIRYGHLHKKIDEQVVKDLHVIYEGHWDLRKPNDLVILTSGSGSTSQTLDYAVQAFISGMRVFGITSFENSDLGKLSKRVDGCLVIPGRREPFSMYNFASEERKNYLPEFELNVYLTMDALLAQIASDHDITEKDMLSSHRSKVLE